MRLFDQSEARSITKPFEHSALIPAFQKLGIGESVLAEMMSFKAAETKNDPSRRQNLHGPYEEFTRRKTGKLPPDYYDAGDPEPWGLRVRESRSNILWQIVSGVLDHQPEFASSYMGLALDRQLDDADYAFELRKLHADFGRYLDRAGAVLDHHHSSMRGVYQSVSCPACSVLTAMACVDGDMHTVFQEMLPMKKSERLELLKDRGLMPLLNAMVPILPEQKP